MKHRASRIGAVIVSAGTSNRMQGIDKIFSSLHNAPLLARVLETFHKCPSVDDIVVVLSQDNLRRGQELIKDKGFSKVCAVCTGGTRRQDSVKAGLQCLEDCDWVVIHDGARPCITTEIIENGLIAAERTGAAIAAVPVKDTIKVVSDSGIIERTPERHSLWIAQTPQIFEYKLIMEAYNQSDEDITDDATLVERSGHDVEVYMGSYQNVKVTTPEDLEIAALFFKNREH